MLRVEDDVATKVGRGVEKASAVLACMQKRAANKKSSERIILSSIARLLGGSVSNCTRGKRLGQVFGCYRLLLRCWSVEVMVWYGG